jgi:glutamate-1-semialdehyde 2,1-aminomutase
MRLYGKGVAHGGTYTAQALSLAAAEKTLTLLRDTDALERVAAYGKAMQEGMHKVLAKRGIPHSFTGHYSMSGLFFSAEAPTTYRNWKNSDYTFYDTMAGYLIDMGVMCEPDSREPWFISSAHDEICLAETLKKFEEAVDLTLAELAQGRSQREDVLMPGISG